MKDYITYLKFDTYSEQEIFEIYQQKIVSKENCVTITPNLDGLRVSYKNQKLRNVINNYADIVTIDGKPIIWLKKILHKKQFKYKISGSDLSVSLIELAAKNNYSLLFFGGKEGVGQRAKENLLKKYPNLVINAITPDFGYEKDESKSNEYIELINSYNADIVFLCTGFPKTELFYYDNRDKFKPAVYLFVGATVDFLAGSVKRAPKWMSKVGLEWFYRLTKDFRRLFKRYWLDFWFLQKMFLICIFHRKKFKKIIERDNING